ncbi:VWA domain-containing protein [Paracrocinitomix mangrovi]|uniref:vWA domain-containing protein n=1 Tax=Paracrocinitomix mangrovi TaxID=2862509 RepID=UPI001EDC4618|nr:VWA domain-containing protein [Paracrocinitomix mangrovi]UKN01313.1 VWA domain-containing protein [Paracrocinitomix mangrovi]
MKVSAFNIWPFDMEFDYPHVFWMLLVIPGMVVWYIYKQKQDFKHINISSTGNFGEAKINWISVFRYINLSILMIGIAYVILALARPHAPIDVDEYRKKNIEGIDIVISMDVSESMLAQDLKPNRLEAAKDVAKDFIEDRPTDRIGLVVYEAEAYTQSPMTTDHELLLQQLSEVKPGMVTPGTAIGVGLITAAIRLSESDAKSKVIILMTDGLNNSGQIQPTEAAEVAKELGICVYTIGVGQEGSAPYPFIGNLTTNIPVQIDEELLTDIAIMTGGKYFRARNKDELKNIYSEIDQLEKSKVKVLDFKVNPPEKYYGFLLMGIILILLNRVIENTALKSIP